MQVFIQSFQTKYICRKKKADIKSALVSWWSIGGSTNRFGLLIANLALQLLARALRCARIETAHWAVSPSRGSIPRTVTEKIKADIKSALIFMVEHRGIEPLTSWLPAMRSPS